MRYQSYKSRSITKSYKSDHFEIIVMFLPIAYLMKFQAALAKWF